MSPQPAQVSLQITWRTPTVQTPSTHPSRDSLHGFVLQASSLEKEKETHPSPACAFSVYTPRASIKTHLHLLTLHVPTSRGLRSYVLSPGWAFSVPQSHQPFCKSSNSHSTISWITLFSNWPPAHRQVTVLHQNPNSATGVPRNLAWPTRNQRKLV